MYNDWSCHFNEAACKCTAPKRSRRAHQSGKEKGNFAFGGSTVILMTQKERVLPDPDIFMNSENGIETRVKLGERIGVSEVLDG